MPSKCIHVNFKRDCCSLVEENTEDWVTTTGLEICNEQTGKVFIESGPEVTTQASDVPEARGCCQCVFFTNVPPYWKDEIVQNVF